MEKNFKLDITLENCPMTFVKTKIELHKLKRGDVLEVTLKEGEPLENVPRSAAEDGHEIIETIELGGGIYRVTIRKC